jgi:hypothetical protein
MTNRVHPTLVATLVFLLPGLCARAAPPGQIAPAGGETYQKIMGEYQAASQTFSEAYGAAADDAARQKVIEEKYPKNEDYASRLFAFAEQNPDDPAAVDALAWVAVYSRAKAPAAVERLTTRYVDSDKLGDVCRQLGYNVEPSTEAALTKIIEKNPHRDMKAKATFALGMYYANTKRPADAEKRFEDVIASYGDVPSYRGTFGEAAKSQIHEIRDLAVGKTAPEIEGEDVDGKHFKLSEYRGKVVVLDFWGDW